VFDDELPENTNKDKVKNNSWKADKIGLHSKDKNSNQKINKKKKPLDTLELE
jgi:hypothetical protein